MSKDTEKTLGDETDQLVDRIVKRGVDGVIGGFPCQDVSLMGAGAGLAGARSGLFGAMAETVRMVGARKWLVENVAALLDRGMGIILGAMAASGFDAEWDCVGAGTVGAPHHRARIYILAHDPSQRVQRYFPRSIQRQPEFSFFENVRRLEDLPQRSDLYESLVCGGGIRVAERLHAIGNGNPPCVIRELTKGLTNEI